MSNPSLKDLAVAIRCATAGAALVAAPLVQAVETESVVNYSIPPGALTTALNQFARQSGVAVVMDDGQLRDLQTKGLQGLYSVAQGFSNLLQGSGYQVRKTSVGYILEPVTTQGDADDVITLDPIRVESTAEARFGDAPAEPGGFKAEYQSTATKTALPLKETPQAIYVVTRDSLDARQVKDLATAVELTPGISTYFGTNGAFGGISKVSSSLSSRGQEADLRTGGFKLVGDDRVDLAAYERIEVVKGPSGFYGQGSLGGFINAVRKKPQADFAADISVQAGSFDTYRAETNITGAFTEQENFRGQLSMAHDDAGAFVEGLKNERIFFAPSLEWVVSDRTRILFQTLYQKDRYDASLGTALNLVGDQMKLYNNRFGSRRKLQGRTGEKSKEENARTSITLDHELSDQWLASLLLQHSDRKLRHIDNNYATVYYGDVYIYAGRRDNDDDTWAGELRLKGEFSAFGQAHKLLLGLEKNQEKIIWNGGYVYTNLGSVDNFNGIIPASLSVLGKDIPMQNTRDTITKNRAVYGQLVLSLHERTKLLIGARYDRASQYELQEYHLNGRITGGDTIVNHALTTRLGLTQKITDNISAYGTYAESFTPIRSEGRNGILDPETGEGYELGLKTDWFDNRLGANLVVYHQELDNRAIPDPTNRGGESFSVSSGLHRADGVELEITGSPYPGLTIAAAASWSDNEFTEQGDPNKGLSFDGSADRQYSLYANYEWQTGPLTGLGVGATLVSVGERQYIHLAKQIYLEGYERLDLNLSYNGLSNWDIALLVRNITDKKYIESSSVPSSHNYFGSPRAGLLKATYHF